VIKINNMKKYYKNKLVLDVPVLNINDATINYFTGKNGSGKTTLMLIICGFIHQTEGVVMVEGHKNTSGFVRKNSYVALESGKGFYEYLTAMENIKYFLGINQIKFKQSEEKFYHLSEEFSFSEHINKKISELSQGNRQKLSLIMSLLVNSKIIALDEPTNGLDNSSKQMLLNKLEELKEKGTTVLITTHDLFLTNNSTSTNYRLSEGQIISVN